MKKKSISILGSTGSIGLSTLNIIDKKKSFFKLNLLSANKNYKFICSQLKKYQPNYFIISDKKIFEKVKKKFKNKRTKILNSFEIKYLNKKSDIIVSAIPGIAGLYPTLSMMKYTKKMLIANKESIICGWDLIKNKSIKYKVKIVPIDLSIFQFLN